MSKKLFVGGLSWDTDENGLRTAFEPYGDLEDVKVISDRDTGRSRGFGFVTFAANSAAENAITAMDGGQLDGRNIAVNEAKERNDRGGRGGGGGGYGGGGGGRW
jgi:RNA recognition motif-containing protein